MGDLLVTSAVIALLDWTDLSAMLPLLNGEQAIYPLTTSHHLIMVLCVYVCIVHCGEEEYPDFTGSPSLSGRPLNSLWHTLGYSRGK